MSTRISTTAPPTSRAAAGRMIGWLPALVAAAYVVVVVVHFQAFIRALYWDSDAAGAFVLGALGHGNGGVVIPRFGFWTSLWWLLGTRRLPAHEHLWEVTGYTFALTTAALVGWATSRVAGRWAGVTAAAAAIVVGPVALRSLLTVNLHTSTPFTAAVLAAYLVVLGSSRVWLLAVAVGVLAGLNAASDPLLWIAGIAPFALSAGVLASATRRREIAGQGAVVLGVAAISAFSTDRLMRSLDFHIIPVGLEPARMADLIPNFVSLGKSIALLFGANFLSYPTYPIDPIRSLVALLGFAALAATVLAAVRLTVHRSEPTRWAYACFWATSALLIGLAYWTTNQAAGSGPEGGVRYMLTLAPAAGVGAAMLGAESLNRRVVVSFAIALVGVVNVAGVGRAAEHVNAGTNGPEIIRVLRREGLTRGYAPFWDAQSLTWQSGMRLLVAPVHTCHPPRGRDLCRDNFFTIDSWYDERPGPSFLIVDPAGGLWTKPPHALGRPTEAHHFGSNVTVYVYPYDIARQIRSSGQGER